MIDSKHHKHAVRGQAGFTIVELMIATGVFSTILLLVTIVMVSIGNLYYKGVNQARIQDATRAVTDELSQQLQFSGQSLSTATWPAKNEQAYCIGSTRYTYVLGVQLGHPAPGTSLPVYDHILWRDTNPTPGSCSINPNDPDNVTPVDLTQSTPSSGGTELISANSTLTALCIGALINPATGTCPYGSLSTTSPFPLAVSMAYGDQDLLNLNGFNTVCKTGNSDRFCSTAELQTTVVQRL